MLLQSFMEGSATRYPDKVALVADERRLTYRQLDEMANRLAYALLDMGVQRGDRVAIYMGNCPEMVVSLFAVLKAGGVFVIINPTTKADKLAFMLDNCRASVLVSHARLEPMYAEARVPSLRGLIVVGEHELTVRDGTLPTRRYDAVQAEYSAARPPVRNIDMDLAALIYTSGSTGFPKGVMCAHCNMVAAATSITTYLQNVPDDIIINVLPLSFDYGLYQLLMAFKTGATLVLERGFAYPHAVLSRIVQEGVTGFPGVPTLFAMLLQIKDLDRYDFSRLRYVTNTAAALPVEHIQRLRDIFSGAALYSMYGLTECKRVSYLPPQDLDRRPGSVGIAIPNTELWIIDEEGRRVGPNTVGELVVRGPHVMRGYWENPQATAEKYRPGPLPGEQVLHTGDLCRMDEDGYLYFVARQDDIIKCRGEKVSPKEVEAALYAMPEIAEAAVVGVDDPVLGQAIKAILVPIEGATLTERDVITHCRRHLEDYLVPTLVEFRTELPRNPSGKVDRISLRPSPLNSAAEVRDGVCAE